MNKQWKMGLVVLVLGCLTQAAYAVEKTTVENSAKPVASTAMVVNVNTATAAQLSSIKGLGPKKAQAIIDYRQEHGPFKQVEDLSQVTGISDKLLANIKPYITVNS
ncbi:MAG: helix-hairpin-helix domain-containing protein [Gammaproteobacteria bacterium]|nr:helix-hairpin-helix domain-containing protein [Gammaproteobacteria bacterium]